MHMLHTFFWLGAFCEGLAFAMRRLIGLCHPLQTTIKTSLSSGSQASLGRYLNPRPHPSPRRPSPSALPWPTLATKKAELRFRGCCWRAGPPWDQRSPAL